MRKRNLRPDIEPIDRVELHCHTRYTEMDAVPSPEDVVMEAYGLDMPAIAITDLGNVQAFPEAYRTWKKLWDRHVRLCSEDGEIADKTNFFKVIYGMECYLVDDTETARDEDTNVVPHRCMILIANETGRVNLYRLFTRSYTEHFKDVPRIFKSKLRENRDGLFVGCLAEELFNLLTVAENEAAEEKVAFYDYLEIQPADNFSYMVDGCDPLYRGIRTIEDICGLNRRIVEIGDKLHIPVVATSNAHFLNPEDAIYRDILQTATGAPCAGKQHTWYLHTAREMLDSFAYLGEEKAREIMIDNAEKIADRIEHINPLREDRCYPHIPDADKSLRETVYARARKIYGDELPVIVRDRLERELEAITANDCSSIYVIFQKLVEKSISDGYLVGARGAVGSSLVAFMAGITDVNPLPAHFVCPRCHYADFDSGAVKQVADGCGADLPDKACPLCGESLVGEGFNIPAETFIGVNGDKEPDIDLNFARSYQGKAQKYVSKIPGIGAVYRAGTIGLLSKQTAYRYVQEYLGNENICVEDDEADRLADGITGVKKSVGFHPGGIVALPEDEDINTFTPVQFTEIDGNRRMPVTHFDYHSIDHNLLKLDILGHDDPQMLHLLQELTGVDPQAIPLRDAQVMSLFELGVHSPTEFKN